MCNRSPSDPNVAGHPEVRTVPNITLAIDEECLQAGREYARKHNTSVNALVRNLLSQTARRDSQDWLTECFELMDRVGGHSDGRTWTREELYDA